METMRSNSSNKASANKDPGIYTCPTCNALFTCLKFYQQHVSQHAEANGTKLFCCNRCRYSTDSSFQYNWHQMSHKNTPPHSCSVCQDKSVVDSYNSNNHLNGREDSVATGKSPRKAQQNGNSNKRVKYSNSKVKQEPYVKQEESDDEDDEEEESDEGESDTEENDDEENENEEDDEEASDSEEEESEEDEDEMDKDVDHSQANVTTYELASINQGEEDEEMSDEDDDEESEIESEEDNGENNDVPDEYLVSQRLNRQEGDSTDYHYDMQNANAHVSNNNSSANKASEAYATAINVADLPELAVNDGIIINNKGKGKGNRKSRTINQMGGQVDDEMSQLRRKFHCSHCGKSFKTKSHLQRHILTHTGEKPYHCNRCGAKFNQSSSLRNHIIALHTKEYPHFCNHCNKGFLMPALLQKHLQTSHRDQD